MSHARREFGSYELCFEPCAALICVVRRFVTEFYDKLLDDPEIVSVMALATHELLENTVKYSADGRASLSISVDSANGTLSVRVRTRNLARTGHVAELERRFAEMKSARDRSAYYQRAIRDSLRVTTGSGLGLARLFAETEMDLGLNVAREEVEIVAVRHLQLPECELEESCNA